MQSRPPEVEATCSRLGVGDRECGISPRRASYEWGMRSPRQCRVIATPLYPARHLGVDAQARGIGEEAGLWPGRASNMIDPGVSARPWR